MAFFLYDPLRKPPVNVGLQRHHDSNDWCGAASPNQSRVCTLKKHTDDLHISHFGDGRMVVEWLTGDPNDVYILCGDCHQYQTCTCGSSRPGFKNGKYAGPSMKALVSGASPPSGTPSTTAKPAVPSTPTPVPVVKKEDSWLDEWDLLPDA